MDAQETDMSLIKKPTRVFVPADPAFEWVNPEEFATPVNDSVVQVVFDRYAVTNVDGWILTFKQRPQMNPSQMVMDVLLKSYVPLGAHRVTFFPLLFVPLPYVDY